MFQVDVYWTWTLLSSIAKSSVPTIINTIYFCIKTVLITCTHNHYNQDCCCFMVEDPNALQLILYFYSPADFSFRPTEILQWFPKCENEVYTILLMRIFPLQYPCWMTFSRAHTPSHELINSGIFMPWLSGCWVTGDARPVPTAQLTLTQEKTEIPELPDKEQGWMWHFGDIPPALPVLLQCHRNQRDTGPVQRKVWLLCRGQGKDRFICSLNNV